MFASFIHLLTSSLITAATYQLATPRPLLVRRFEECHMTGTNARFLRVTGLSAPLAFRFRRVGNGRACWLVQRPARPIAVSQRNRVLPNSGVKVLLFFFLFVTKQGAGRL